MLRLLRRAVAAPRLGPALLAALHLAAVALFVHGFLLTRVHLTERSTAPPSAAGADNRTAAAPYDRVVWLMIDALRYDFVVSDGRYSCTPQQQHKGQEQGQGVCHQGHMPYLAELAKREDAARAFMFIADAPTTTTQRLKSMATGGLPSFFDVSNSFTVGGLAEDNLIDQLADAGKRMAFLGDTTWQQLFPRHWAWSRPYPCFNVRDLHTVDDGIWRHLLPALGQPGAATWDGLLVAHYLGVDHCGHSHGVASTEMVDKLRQMDDHVWQVVGALLEQASPGGTHERTLLLVSGDHGQTLGGDHGGGSPEEVDSALVAVDIGALHASMHSGGEQAASGAGLLAPAACRANCSCGVEGNQCAPDLLQMDLTPSLAALLGVPIPFGNLGKLSTELWQLPASREAASPGGNGGRGDGQAAWEHSLAAALLANAQQVHTYLNTYAATAGASFSGAALASLTPLYAALASPGAEVADTVSRCYVFLEAAADVARQQWTQFGEPAMVAGLGLLAATLVLHAAAAFGGKTSTTEASQAKPRGKEATAVAAAASGGRGGALAALWRQLQAWQLVGRVGRGRLPVPSFCAWLAGAALAHGLGVFSFFYLLSEGRTVCLLVAAACVALALSVGRATRAAGKAVRGVIGLGIMCLRFNGLMMVLGVAHHTGQGFWARLTVHESQPADDVERGWHGKLAKVKALAASALAAAGVGRLPPAVLAVAQHSLLCTLPILVLAAATQRAQGGSPRGVLMRWLPLAAFASVAAYQQLEDATKRGLLPKAVTLEQLAGQHLWPLLPAELAVRLQMVLASAVHAVPAALPHAAQLASRLVTLPLPALLPHVTCALCGALAALWLVQVASRRLRGAAAATAAAQLVLAALLQVSDRQAPLILLLAFFELVAISKLLARRAELLPAGCVKGVAGEAGALAALLSAQLFYVTGHMCEFAGLQYTAGFIGMEEFHLWRSGGMVALNTFGGMLLPLLALPAVVQHVQAAARASAAGARETGTAGQQSQGHNTIIAEATPAAAPAAAAAAARGGIMEDSAGAGLRQALLVAGLVRAFTGFCAALSAGLQRRHLYAWALFAPRFTFEACFVALTDMALLLLAMVA